MANGPNSSQTEARLRFTATNATDHTFQQISRNFQRVSRDADRAMRASEASTWRFAGGLAGFERRLTMATATMGLGIYARESVRAFADTERRMLRLQNNAEATAGQMRSLGAQIQDVARRTGQSTSDVTAGFEKMIQAGLSFDKAAASLELVAKANQAIGAEMAETASTAEVLQSALEFKPDQLERAFEIIAGGAKMGKFEAKDLARYLPQIGPALAAIGYKGEAGLSKAVSALEIIHKGTGNAEQAAIGLSDVMQRMATPDMVNNFKAVGYPLQQVMDTARRGGKDMLATFVQATDQALSIAAQKRNIAEKDKYQLLPAFFPERDSRQAMMMLLRHFDDVGRGATKLRRDTKGLIDKDARPLIEDTTSKLERLQTAWENLQKATGKALVDLGAISGLEELSQRLNDILPTIQSAIQIFKDLTENPYETGGSYIAQGLDATNLRMTEGNERAARARALRLGQDLEAARGRLAGTTRPADRANIEDEIATIRKQIEEMNRLADIRAKEAQTLRDQIGARSQAIRRNVEETNRARDDIEMRGRGGPADPAPAMPLPREIQPRLYEQPAGPETPRRPALGRGEPAIQFTDMMRRRLEEEARRPQPPVDPRSAIGGNRALDYTDMFRSRREAQEAAPPPPPAPSGRQPALGRGQPAIRYDDMFNGRRRAPEPTPIPQSVRPAPYGEDPEDIERLRRLLQPSSFQGAAYDAPETLEDIQTEARATNEWLKRIYEEDTLVGGIGNDDLSGEGSDSLGGGSGGAGSAGGGGGTGSGRFRQGGGGQMAPGDRDPVSGMSGGGYGGDPYASPVAPQGSGQTGTQARPPGRAGQYRPVYNVGDRDLSDEVVNTIAGEARTSSREGVDAVINNMMNRVGTKGWGPSGDLQDVARAPGQYAGYRRANPREAEMIRERIKAIAGGTVPDNTGGSNSFRAEGYYQGTRGRGKGYWADRADIGPNVGGNRFAYDPAVPAGPNSSYRNEAGVNLPAPAGRAPLEMANRGATRNKPISDELQAQIQASVAAVYGEGYTAQVYSGGQDRIGHGRRRTGSTRHDDGHAADTYVVGPDGQRVRGEELAKLGQYWRAKKIGGVGMEMRGGGIHLDTHKDRAGQWRYGPIGREAEARMRAGERGEMPELRGVQQQQAREAQRPAAPDLREREDSVAPRADLDGLRQIKAEMQQPIDVKFNGGYLTRMRERGQQQARREFGREIRSARHHSFSDVGVA